MCDSCSYSFRTTSVEKLYSLRAPQLKILMLENRELVEMILARILLPCSLAELLNDKCFRLDYYYKWSSCRENTIRWTIESVWNRSKFGSKWLSCSIWFHCFCASELKHNAIHPKTTHYSVDQYELLNWFGSFQIVVCTCSTVDSESAANWHRMNFRVNYYLLHMRSHHPNFQLHDTIWNSDCTATNKGKQFRETWRAPTYFANIIVYS